MCFIMRRLVWRSGRAPGPALVLTPRALDRLTGAPVLLPINPSEPGLARPRRFGLSLPVTTPRLPPNHDRSDANAALISSGLRAIAIR